MKTLKLSTARNVMVFMSDSTDHVSGKTGLTVTVTASKDGGAFAGISPTVTERGNGWYNLALTAGMTDTLGDLIIRATGAAADPSDIPCMVQGGLVDADVSTRSTYAGGAVASVTAAVTLPTIPANWITAAGVNAAALNGKGDWTIGKTGYSLTATTGLGNQTANIAGSVTSVTNDVGITQGGADKAWSTAARVLTAGTNIALAKGTGVTGFTDLSATQVENAVWDAATASHVSAGTTGQAIGAAGAAGDPWAIALPGGYSVGSAGEILGNFQTAISGSSGISTLATGFALTTGIETNTYTNTQSADATVHTLDDVGNVIDGYYSFDVGSDGIPSGVTFVANLQSGNDSLGIYGWNWGASLWDQVGTLPGTANSSLATYDFPLQTRHVGTGANDGVVRVRFAGGSSSPTFQVDYVYVNYAVVSRTTSYNGLAQAGSASTLTFPASASAVTDFYKPGLISLVSGAGAGQSRRISDYNGTTKVATVATDWAVAPDNTTEFTLLPWATVRVSEIDDGTITAVSIAASALNGKGNWNIGKTGYSLTATTGLGNQTANITGTLSGSVGSVTGAVASVTAAITLPSIPANWITAAGINAAALAGKGDWNVGKTGYALSGAQTFSNTGTWTGNLSGSVGSVTGLTAANLDVAVSTRLATAGYTVPPTASDNADATWAKVLP